MPWLKRKAGGKTPSYKLWYKNYIIVFGQGMTDVEGPWKQFGRFPTFEKAVEIAERLAKKSGIAQTFIQYKDTPLPS